MFFVCEELQYRKCRDIRGKTVEHYVSWPQTIRACLLALKRSTNPYIIFEFV